MAIQKLLQQRWQFAQRVVKGIGRNFKKVADVIKKDFLPALFDDTFEENDWRVSLANLPASETRWTHSPQPYQGS